MPSRRLVLSKSYQRLTPDPKITSESKRKDKGEVNTTQAVTPPSASHHLIS